METHTKTAVLATFDLLIRENASIDVHVLTHLTDNLPKENSDYFYVLD